MKITINPQRQKLLNELNRREAERQRARKARPPVNLTVTLTPDEADSLTAHIEYAAFLNARESGENYDPFLSTAVKKIKEVVRA